MFGSLEESNLFTFKFHLLEHVCKDHSRFADLSALNDSRYEHFNFSIEKFILITPMRKVASVKKTARPMSGNTVSADFYESSRFTDRGACLAREGFSFPSKSCAASSTLCLAHRSKEEIFSISNLSLLYIC